MREFSFRTRKQNIEKFKSDTFDLVIIGGGITGAGAARDAASRGMKVALIEANDFAFGTSSRSSKLIHGGIRYLENLEFNLVFEALSERRILFDLAPHLVHPLRFVLPLYQGDRVSPFLMGIGMWLYDALALFDVPELHRFLTATQSLETAPHLRKEGLRGAFEYSDAYMDDDRLVLETLRSANDMGVAAANYVRATGVQMVEGMARAVICKDQKSDEAFEIRAKHIISTVGPWTDELGASIFKDWKKLLRPSKGVHIIIEKKRLPIDKAIVMSTRTDKRIVFVIPRNEIVIIGTTDTDYKGSPAEVHTDASDVEYLLKITAEYFPTAKIQKSDLIASYAGVRPLVADDASTESATSREHLILEDPRNVTFVAGGKYTTYRRMAEQTVDAALGTFSLEDRIRFKQNDTKKPLNSMASTENLRRARTLSDRWATEFGFKPIEMSLLVERHAMEAEKLIEKGLKHRLKNIWEIEAFHALHNTMCLTLEDFYIRRVPLFLGHRDHGLEFLKPLGQVFARGLNWSEQDLKQNEAGIHSHIAKELSWQK